MIKIKFFSEICDLDAFCRDYNGRTLFIDSTTEVNYYEDVVPCKSYGGEIYIPKTEADNVALKNLIIAYNNYFDINVLGYPLFIKNGTLIWNDGLETSK